MTYIQTYPPAILLLPVRQLHIAVREMPVSLDACAVDTYLFEFPDICICSTAFWGLLPCINLPSLISLCPFALFSPQVVRRILSKVYGLLSSMRSIDGDFSLSHPDFLYSFQIWLCKSVFKNLSLNSFKPYAGGGKPFFFDRCTCDQYIVPK